jgi:predicted amidohydrolase YtcJ
MRLVLVGGTVRTMEPSCPTTDAVAIDGERVVALGEAARAQVASAERVIDLAGGELVPGLVDGHCHLYGLGRSMDGIDLRGVTREEDAAARVAEAAGADDWIQGRGWDQNLWVGAHMPTRATLDAAAPGRAIVLRRIDGHALWCSSTALARAGIDAASVDPPGGKILRDASGAPTGVLVDRAGEPVLQAIPADDAAARERMILAAAARAVAHGLTGVHEMGIDDATIAAYRRLAADGRLPLRVYAFLDGEGQLGALATRAPDLDADGRARFTLRGVKLYADGALGSRGAHLLAPYSDDPGNVGLELLAPGEIVEAARACARTGWQLGVHAIGDRANRACMDAFAPYAGRGLRFRVEHAQIVAPDDLARFGQLGVLAAMQPSHATSDAPWAESRLGRARLAGAYAWRTILRGGACVVGGSDFPIETIPPLAGLHAACTWDGPERLTLDEALALYTTAPAYASFQEGRRGVIRPGAIADLTLFDRPLDPARLLDVRVSATLVGGEVVYAARAM